MPRGVAIPEVRRQLFDAASRLLDRDGPGGLSSRAITAEAGCAKGLLHNHFGDFDGFLAEFLLDRFHFALEAFVDLESLAGTGSVSENLALAAGRLFESQALTVTTVIMSRPTLMVRMHEKAADADVATMLRMMHGFVAYLEAEKRLGRVAAGADTGAAVMALLATAHHLFVLHSGAGDPRAELRRVAELLTTGLAP